MLSSFPETQCSKNQLKELFGLGTLVINYVYVPFPREEPNRNPVFQGRRRDILYKVGEGRASG